jgi:hypothetical protein
VRPIDFLQKNGDLLKPTGMTDRECASLPCYRDGREVISCWRATWRERISVLMHGRVWLRVLSGATQPPVSLDGVRSIFSPSSPPDPEGGR